MAYRARVALVVFTLGLLAGCSEGPGGVLLPRPARSDDPRGGSDQGARPPPSEGATAPTPLPEDPSSTTTAPPNDGGRGARNDGGSDGGPRAPDGYVPGLVGVGYGGLRITSRDGGKTWARGAVAANGGVDDENLLRAVAYANGRWLATGWCATTSLDGVTWAPLARINQPGGVTWSGAPSCGLVEGLTSDGAYFYAACAEYGGPHKAYRSADGSTWTEVGTIGNVGGHPALAHRAGMFYAYGDPGASFRSADGVTWAAAPGLTQATFCEGQWKSKAACRDASWFGGFYFSAIWQSRVTRSEDGATFVVVHDDTSNNTLYAPRAMAEGRVRP